MPTVEEAQSRVDAARAALSSHDEHQRNVEQTLKQERVAVNQEYQAAEAELEAALAAEREVVDAPDQIVEG